MTRRIVLYCPIHGEVELTSEEYRKQLWRANSRWFYPHCGQIANWDGIYHKCLS